MHRAGFVFFNLYPAFHKGHLHISIVFISGKVEGGSEDFDSNTFCSTDLHRPIFVMAHLEIPFSGKEKVPDVCRESLRNRQFRLSVQTYYRTVRKDYRTLSAGIGHIRNRPRILAHQEFRTTAGVEVLLNSIVAVEIQIDRSGEERNGQDGRDMYNCREYTTLFRKDAVGHPGKDILGFQRRKTIHVLRRLLEPVCHTPAFTPSGLTHYISE